MEMSYAVMTSERRRGAGKRSAKSSSFQQVSPNLLLHEFPEGFIAGGNLFQ